METLHDLVVTPEDIDQSYSNRLQSLTAYRTIVEHANRPTDNTMSAHARSLGYSRTGTPGEYARVACQFNNWVNKGVVPRAVQTILALHQAGVFPSKKDSVHDDPLLRIVHDEILPFNATNTSLLHFINLLTSYIFWRGTTSDQSTNTGTNLTIHKSFIDEDISTLMQPAFKNPGSDYPQLSAPYGRLFRLLGIPIGHKGKSSLPFPRPIQFALGTLSDSSSSEDDQKTARRLLRDFILSFFYGKKCSYSDSRGFSGRFPFSESLTIAEQRKDIFLEALDIGNFGFSTGVNAVHMFLGDKVKRDHSYIIRFPDMRPDDLEGLRSEFRERVSNVVCSLPSQGIAGDEGAFALL